MHPLAKLDHQFVWHPFTQMRDWLTQEPLVIVSGHGPYLRDQHGKEYLDANASIWTNLHGHAHPKINAAIRRQLGKIAHSSALGFANEPASLLARDLIAAANPAGLSPQRGVFSNPALGKVFFGDDGSTAIEAALKMAYEYARRVEGDKQPRFLSLQGAYHGDTVGAVSVGHIDLFHKTYAGLLFKSDKAPAPYCYRCPFNRSRPERADARDTHRCHWECLTQLERCFSRQQKRGRRYAGFVFEPLMQGSAGMVAQPLGWLRQAAVIARSHGALLIADEVMTGFGRSGLPESPAASTAASASLFACHHEDVQPDLMALAKGLTGGYLPMAATLTSQAVFEAFLGRYDEFKSFFHGHSFTGNQLCAVAGLANLQLLASPAVTRARRALQQSLHAGLQTLWQHPCVGDIRQVGIVAGIELVKDWRTREAFDGRQQIGIRVCQAMARHGVLTRPVGNVIVLLLPYCVKPREATRIIHALDAALTQLDRGTLPCA